MRNHPVPWCLYFVLAAVLSLSVNSRSVSAQTAAEALQRYSGLSVEERKRALEAGAKKEGSVSFYGTISVKDAQVLIDKFHQQYPYVKVRHIRAGSSPLLSRILTEHRGGRRDVDVVGITGAGAQVLVVPQGQPARHEHQVCRCNESRAGCDLSGWPSPGFV